MRSDSLFEKLTTLVIYVGSFIPLYLTLKVVFLGVTLYVAYFMYAFNGGTDVDAFRAGSTYALLVGADYVLAILVAVYLAKKIGDGSRRVLFASPERQPSSRG